MWYIHSVEYYSAIKRTEVLIHATTCMTFEILCLSEKKPVIKNQIQYDSIHVKGFRIGKSIKTESSLVVPRAWGDRRQGSDC